MARKNFESWNECLKTGNLEKIVDLYTEGAVLLATFSHDIRKGHSKIREYFHHFMEQHPVGTITKQEIIVLASGVYSHDGNYDFEVDDGQGGRKIVEARFTYDWKQNEKGEWKIVLHHSSVKPK